MDVHQRTLERPPHACTPPCTSTNAGQKMPIYFADEAGGLACLGPGQAPFRASQTKLSSALCWRWAAIVIQSLT